MSADEDLSWLEGGADIPRVPVRDLDKRELAAAFGEPLKTIDRWCREGLPCRSTGSKRNGLRFDLAAAIAWRIANEIAAQGGGDENSLANAKRRNAIAQARRRELENAKLQGDLFPTELFERIVSDRYALFKTRLQRIDMEAFGLTARQHDDIRSAVDDALREISLARFSGDIERDLIAFEEPSV